MSRGYRATPLWGLSLNSAVAGIFFVKISRLQIVRICVGRDEIGAPLKTPAWEAIKNRGRTKSLDCDN